jgi:phosphonatase-like hydrolase
VYTKAAAPSSSRLTLGGTRRCRVPETTMTLVSRAPALVVFDLGGTTIRDNGDVPAAFVEALAAAKLHVEAGEIDGWRGASKREVIRRLVTERRSDLSSEAQETLASSVYGEFRTVLAARLRQAPDLSIPGVTGAFERLQAAGIRVALNSGFDRDILDLILSIVAWPSGLLDAIVCGDDVAEGRPAPHMIFRSMALTGVTDAHRVAVVGDTRLDLEAGLNAGARYRIGVLGGAHDRATLERAPHTHILPSAAAVPDLWQDAGAS